MTSTMWLHNLGAFAIQAGVLIVAAAVLARAFRIEAARAALAYWRALLVACLLLPFSQPWHTAAPTTATVTVVRAERVAATTSGPIVPHPPTWHSGERLVLAALCAGFAARGLWLALGAWVLGRIRREASRLDPIPEAIARAQDRVGVTASFYVSARTAGPVTFGVRRPVIVFPPGIGALDSSTQHAIACHELLHIRRRDWVFQVIEESIRTVLWFHPGVWWLIGRIQLTREQVVDQEAVALLESRERYIEALLAVAIAKSRGFLTPAPAFFRRGLLKKRVAHILQESTMTTRRLMVSLGASAAALALAATMAVRAFPLEAQGQAKTVSGKPVEIVKGGENLLHGELPEYPRRAIEQKVEGDVLLDLAVDDQGEVSDARVLSGPDELRKAALTAALDWHYSPSAVRSASIQATVRFNLPAANTEFRGIAYSVEMKEPHGELTRLRSVIMAEQIERLIAELQRALEDEKITGSQREEYKAKLAKASAEMEHINAERSAMVDERVEVTPDAAGKGEGYRGPLRLVAFETERVSAEAAGEVMKRAGVKIGDTITEDSLKSLRAAAAAVDEHFELVMHNDGHGGVSLVLVSRE
jgi:TonB family protein